MDKIVHALDTADVTRVVAEEDTTEGGKGAHHVRLERHRGLDTRGVGRSRETDCSARHGGGDVATAMR